MEYLIIAALIGIGGWILILRQKESKHTNQSQSTQPKSATSEDKNKAILDKKYPSLDEQIGADHCSGLTCNLNDKCQDAEIVFCHTILKKAGIPPEHIIGQFPFPVPISVNTSGIGKIDFAVKTPDGRALAIELDGFKFHAQLDPKQFDKQQKRQNELVVAGWTVLRFTAYDMKKRQDYCINLIKKIYSTAKDTVSPNGCINHFCRL